MLSSCLVHPVLLAAEEYRNFEWRFFIENRFDGKLGEHSWLKIPEKDAFTTIAQPDHSNQQIPH